MFLLDKKKKIHFVHYDAGPGGMEVLLPVIIKELPNFNFSVYLLRNKKNGVNVYDGTAVPIQYGDNNNFKAYIKAFRYARKNRKEIFHVYNIGPVFLLIFRLARVKNIVYSIHGTVYWKSSLKKILFKTIWKLGLNKQIVLIANSEHSKNEFIKKVSNEYKIQVVYNPVDGDRFKGGKISRTDGKSNIIYVGRLANGKNLHRWIDIAIAVHQELPATVFTIYGDGALKNELTDYVSSHKAENYIHLPGFRKDIENIYREGDVLLFLSEYESFGNVVVESILSNTPVIVSPIPSMQEIFKDYPQFLLSTDMKKWEEEVSDKIHNLVTLKQLALTAGKNFKERFGISQHMNALTKIYENAN
jgi:glycosyltransferase involved in cell wall biosynthesis